MLVMWLPPYTKGDEVQCCFVESSIVKTEETGSREFISDIRLSVGKVLVLFTELPNRGLNLCEDILDRGSNKD
jgi:hypothetical protein